MNGIAILHTVCAKCFQSILSAVWRELSWTHLRAIMYLGDELEPIAIAQQRLAVKDEQAQQ